ncbi:MAG: hypothetical protein K5653_00665 [Clostridiales bacterium]|nr:hypothetical protein [Clostridiales bacterium]
MRLEYMDYQIVYLEDTGDASVYTNQKKIIHALMDKGLSPDKVVDCMSFIFRVPEIRKKLALTTN